MPVNYVGYTLLNPALAGVRYYIIDAIARNEAETNERREMSRDIRGEENIGGLSSFFAER